MQCEVNLMKYTDKILPRKWVETECGFSSVCLLYIQVTILVVIHYSWHFQGDNQKYGSLALVQVFVISQCFFVVGLMMKLACMLSKQGP